MIHMGVIIEVCSVLLKYGGCSQRLLTSELNYLNAGEGCTEVVVFPE